MTTRPTTPDISTRYDAVAIGETMVRFAPRGHARLEQADVLAVKVGGSESNTLVGLARLGLRVAWLSRLTRNAWGRRIAGDLAALAVDVSHVQWTDQDRVGTYFVEFGAGPRPGAIVYDRRGSAMSRMGIEDVDLSLLRQTRLLHASGITPALSLRCREMIAALAVEAGQSGALFSFDVNYRTRLWPPEEAAAALDPVCRRADVLFVTRGDAQTVFGIGGDPSEALQRLQERFGPRLIVMTLGADGGAAIDPQGETYLSPSIPTDEVDRVGGGDAFSAGFLFAYLGHHQDSASPARSAPSIEAGLRYGSAMAALKYTIPGDFPIITRDEVEAVLAGPGLRFVR